MIINNRFMLRSFMFILFMIFSPPILVLVVQYSSMLSPKKMADFAFSHLFRVCLFCLTTLHHGD